MRPKPPRGTSPKADAEVDNDVLPTARTAAATTIMVLRIPNLLCGRVLHPSRFPRSYLDAVRVHRSIGRAYQRISFGKAAAIPNPAITTRARRFTWECSRVGFAVDQRPRKNSRRFRILHSRS